MNTCFSLLAVIGISLGLITGCNTISSLTPAQISTVGIVISQTSQTGAAYAIQQNKNNAQYFKDADLAINTLVLGDNLSPAALQAALGKVSGTNQLVNLAISGAVVAYDLALSQYVSGQFTNIPVAKAWITSVENGFNAALVSSGNVGLKAGEPLPVPYFIKDGQVDKTAINDKIKSAGK
jgi:hypothetical protein